MSVPSVPIETQAVPENQEQQFVHEVYNEIAAHFSQTRYKPWPIVEKFLRGQPDYSVGIDVGCGNGKYLGVNPKLVIVGSDRSDGLVTCAQQNSNNAHLLCVADGLHLPHANGRFDFAISIAVIHHFASKARRVDAIRHVLSKVRTRGKFLVYCWALEQEKSRRGYKEGDDQDILVPWVLQKKQKKKPAGAGPGAVPESGDIKTPDLAPETKYRYYHLYREGELVADAETAGGRVVEHGYEKDNWWAIIEKV
ncbi:S-adenosyl-L-methionine-dependent methyltransferase [Metschnikowia bicuspidata var. bicuspidata NRRL YB-4993]|uniref:S-adenosyl-L-methionine-dependent methyltransferase n=1 Tax=Metschnikowia bicuspidata var. bicuspidata NRRL YB-4993 TaxID=869754 RepID=A0A1A0H9V6_9ASCO|nr:S-adenosyl-L-methionine-dependent methyltransferase [Metschnikowia bicuspidata var. bicuspidata NRRL YB-4993]OBA20780.1 S-adenosyl-L-methionine-dependent methyltransferase [Metschnikowia bicuspidata var. bicuspidata NRRL YB-4993]